MSESVFCRCKAPVTVTQVEWCWICGLPVDGATKPLPHLADEDCTVGLNGLCLVCGVDHSGECPFCLAHGFHRPGCPERDDAPRGLPSLPSPPLHPVGLLATPLAGRPTPTPARAGR